MCGAGLKRAVASGSGSKPPAFSRRTGLQTCSSSCVVEVDSGDTHTAALPLRSLHRTRFTFLDTLPVTMPNPISPCKLIRLSFVHVFSLVDSLVPNPAHQ